MARTWRFTCSNGHAPVTWDVTITEQKLQELHAHSRYRYSKNRPTYSEAGAETPAMDTGAKADWVCCATCGSETVSHEEVEV